MGLGEGKIKSPWHLTIRCSRAARYVRRIEKMDQAEKFSALKRNLLGISGELQRRHEFVRGADK